MNSPVASLWKVTRSIEPEMRSTETWLFTVLFCPMSK